MRTLAFLTLLAFSSFAHARPPTVDGFDLQIVSATQRSVLTPLQQAVVDAESEAQQAEQQLKTLEEQKDDAWSDVKGAKLGKGDAKEQLREVRTLNGELLDNAWNEVKIAEGRVELADKEADLAKTAWKLEKKTATAARAGTLKDEYKAAKSRAKERRAEAKKANEHYDVVKAETKKAKAQAKDQLADSKDDIQTQKDQANSLESRRGVARAALKMKQARLDDAKAELEVARARLVVENGGDLDLAPFLSHREETLATYTSKKADYDAVKR